MWCGETPSSLADHCRRFPITGKDMTFWNRSSARFCSHKVLWVLVYEQEKDVITCFNELFIAKKWCLITTPKKWLVDLKKIHLHLLWLSINSFLSNNAKILRCCITIWCFSVFYVFNIFGFFDKQKRQWKVSNVWHFLLL